MDRELVKVYVNILTMGVEIGYYEIQKNKLVIKFNSWRGDANIKIYERVNAICQVCSNVFEVDIAKDLIKKPRNSFGMCEDCEIRQMYQ